MILQKTALEMGYESDIGALGSVTSRTELQARVKALMVMIGNSDLPLTAINSLLAQLLEMVAKMLAELAPDESTDRVPRTAEVSRIDQLLADLDYSQSEADLNAVGKDEEARSNTDARRQPPKPQSNDTPSGNSSKSLGWNGNKRRE